jgi:hypothetical protein
LHDVAALERVLLALPDIALRVDWLRAELSSLEVDVAAALLNGLCEAAQRGEPRAREALLAVAIFFAGLGECELVEHLREQAWGRRLLSLDRFLRRAVSLSASQRPALEVPVPDYGAGRQLTLGERRSLARRPNRRVFEKLASDPHPLVIRQLLENPQLTEDDVVRMAARRPARAELLREVARCARWLTRSRVRMTLLFNPGTPLCISMPLLAVCTRAELLEILDSADTAPVLRVTAHELIERRPPLRDAEALGIN